MSSILTARPSRARWRRRLGAVACSVALAVAGLVAPGATAAYADASIQIAGPSVPVLVNTVYILTVTLPNVTHVSGDTMNLQLTGAPAGIGFPTSGESSNCTLYVGQSRMTCVDQDTGTAVYTFDISPVAAGTITASVSVSGDVNGSASTTTTIVTKAPLPKVTSVSPAQGPLAGGNAVTVTGDGLAGATSIMFGTAPATSVACFTSGAGTYCTAFAPAGAAGKVDVQVTTPGGTSPASGADQYIYRPVPTVTAISPAAGSGAGGTVVTVTGTDLTGASITFGPGHPASAVSCAATTCTATAPAHTAGTVDVQATTPGGTSATSSADQYTYTAADLAVALYAIAAPGLTNASIAFTVVVTNNGPSTLTSATITATLPSFLTARSNACTIAGSLTCPIGVLPSGATTTSTFTVPINLLALGLQFAVTATRTASTPIDTNPANDSATRICTVNTPLAIYCN